MRTILLALLLLPASALAGDPPPALPADPSPPVAADTVDALPLLTPALVTTTEGEVHRGLLVSRSQDDLHLVVDGDDRSLRRDRIADVRPLDIAWPPVSMALVDGKVHTSSGLVVRWHDVLPLLASHPGSRAQLGGYRAMQTGGVVLIATGGAAMVGAGFGTLIEALVEWSWKDLQSPWVVLGGAATTVVGVGLLAGSGAQKHRVVEAYATPLALKGGGGARVTLVW